MADQAFDLVIVGSGVGGLTAGVTAKLAGLEPLVLEKEPLIGGSSAWSGGVLWLPNNPLMQREGIADTREASQCASASAKAPYAPIVLKAQ